MSYDNDLLDKLNITVSIGTVSFKLILNTFFLDHIEGDNERHRHGAFEFHYIANGAGIMEIDGIQYEIAHDKFFLISPGVFHMQKAATVNSIHKYSFKFEYKINKNADHNIPENEVKNLAYILNNTRFYTSKDIFGIKSVILEIQSELKNLYFGYYAKTQFLFSQLIINIIRAISMESKLQFEERTTKLTIENRTKIIDAYFDSNYCTNNTSQDLCRQLHTSKSQLNRILKDMYKMTFKQKQIETRLEYIKDMLIYSDIPLKTISEKSGFDSESNFSAFVKKELNMSPRLYRMLKKDNSNLLPQNTNKKQEN